jgi:hypothetical protein
MLNVVGSYFALQWLANLLVTASALGFCISSPTVKEVALLLNLCLTFGLSLIGTNLLCHRYLCEKARIMIKLYVGRDVSRHSVFADLTPLALFCNNSLNDANDPSIKWLAWLEGSLKWEVRSLVFVAVGVPMILVYQPVGLAIGGLGALLVLVMVRSILCCVILIWALWVTFVFNIHYPVLTVCFYPPPPPHFCLCRTPPFLL